MQAIEHFDAQKLRDIAEVGQTFQRILADMNALRAYERMFPDEIRAASSLSDRIRADHELTQAMIERTAGRGVQVNPEVIDAATAAVRRMSDEK